MGSLLCKHRQIRHDKHMEFSAQPLDEFLDWLDADWSNFDPEQDFTFFDAPGALSLAQGKEVIELPWALSLYRRETRVLDIGTVYVESWYRDALYELGAQELVGLDLREESQDLRYLQGQVLPFESAQFSLIHCLSQTKLLAKPWAIAELYRLLMPSGRLIISMPLGDGYYTQRDWLALLTYCPFNIKTLRYFYEQNGWFECYPDQVFSQNYSGEISGLGCAELIKGAK